MQGCNLRIGIGNILNLLDEPAVALCPRILDGQFAVVLQRQDDVLCVEHVEHSEEAVAIACLKMSASFHNCLIDSAHFSLQMLLDKFLISTQFSWMIATDALVIERGGVVVEGAHTEVQDTIIGVGVL